VNHALEQSLPEHDRIKLIRSCSKAWNKAGAPCVHAVGCPMGPFTSCSKGVELGGTVRKAMATIRWLRLVATPCLGDHRNLLRIRAVPSTPPWRPGLASKRAGSTTSRMIASSEPWRSRACSVAALAAPRSRKHSWLALRIVARNTRARHMPAAVMGAPSHHRMVAEQTGTNQTRFSIPFNANLGVELATKKARYRQNKSGPPPVNASAKCRKELLWI
jgi:hypothetical protein